jgi:hypothetical protein
VRRADVDELIDGICGVTLTHLSTLPARCFCGWRSIERVVFEVRTESLVPLLHLHHSKR